MKDLFWNLFKKSGDIDAFMAYREYENGNFEHKKSIDIKNQYNGEFNG